MPTPKDVSEVERILGVVQYVAKFIPNLSDVTAPLRTLLQQDVEWHWDAPHQESYWLFCDNLLYWLLSYC